MTVLIVYTGMYRPEHTSSVFASPAEKKGDKQRAQCSVEPWIAIQRQVTQHSLCHTTTVQNYSQKYSKKLQGHLNLAVQSTHVRAESGRWALKLEQSLRELTPRHDKLGKELKVCLGLAVTWHVTAGVTIAGWHSASVAAECRFLAADVRAAMVA